MAKKKFVHFYEVYTITSPDGRTHASFVPGKGGVGSSLIIPNGKHSRELLFLHENFWQDKLSDLPGGWPFLFPICGRLERNNQAGNYLYEGRVYQMPDHGFAWRMQWEVTDAFKTDQLTLRLKDNEETRKIYPFQFEVKLIYKVDNNSLTCEQIYTNNSDKPMPYYAGFHPYFLMPQPGHGKEKVLLDYQPIKRFNYNERFTDLLGERELFKCPISIMQPEINEQLTRLGDDKAVNLKYPDGLVLQLKANGVQDLDLFPYIQLYTMPKKPFFCIEPWMGFPNALNAVKGVRWLLPGQSDHGILTLSAEVKK